MLKILHKYPLTLHTGMHTVHSMVIIFFGSSSASVLALCYLRAVGHLEYGPKFREQITESIRRAAEQCDCLQCFFVLHSMGGG